MSIALLIVNPAYYSNSILTYHHTELLPKCSLRCSLTDIFKLFHMYLEPEPLSRVYIPPFSPTFQVPPSRSLLAQGSGLADSAGTLGKEGD